MIRAFNKHYKKAIDLLEDSSSSEKIEMAEKVIDWFRELPEEYLISLALFFNEVIDDLGDESLEKINLKAEQEESGCLRRRMRRARNMMRKKTKIMMTMRRRIISRLSGTTHWILIAKLQRRSIIWAPMNLPAPSSIPSLEDRLLPFV